jgi:hypothetical protein
MNFGFVELTGAEVAVRGFAITATLNLEPAAAEVVEDLAAVWVAVPLCTARVTLICALLAFAATGARTPVAKTATVVASKSLIPFLIFLSLPKNRAIGKRAPPISRVGESPTNPRLPRPESARNRASSRYGVYDLLTLPPSILIRPFTRSGVKDLQRKVTYEINEKTTDKQHRHGGAHPGVSSERPIQTHWRGRHYRLSQSPATVE